MALAAFAPGFVGLGRTQALDKAWLTAHPHYDGAFGEAARDVLANS